MSFRYIILYLSFEYIGFLNYPRRFQPPLLYHARTYIVNIAEKFYNEDNCRRPAPGRVGRGALKQTFTLHLIFVKLKCRAHHSPPVSSFNKYGITFFILHLRHTGRTTDYNYRKVRCSKHRCRNASSSCRRKDKF